MIKEKIRVEFKAGKEYPSECRKTREDVDIKMSNAINEWKK